MTGAERYMVQALVLMGFALFLVIYMFHLRSKYQMQSVEHVQCKFVTEHGTCYRKLLKVVDGFVTLLGNEKKGIPTRDYPVAEVATWQIEYPEGWIPRWLRTTIREMIFREDTWEPLYNRGDKILSPELLSSGRRERFSEIGARQSAEEAEGEKKRRGATTPSLVYLVCAVGILVIAVGVYMYFIMGNVSLDIETIKMHLGA